ncbi:MAG: hypothetical protein F9K38_12435 [Pseudorhodoplanes sp.]|nr:MAG: hypothetical protein F9K38_12435 [Pseudorhodoplanes sp.]
MTGRYSRDPNGDVGFEQPRRRNRVPSARNPAFAQLIMTASLIISIVIAATAVSIGIARADALARLVAPATASALPVAAMLGVLLVLMGVITAAVTGRTDQTTQRD